TLTGGFLFGPWAGGLLADLGCSSGGILVFAVCRLTVGDSLDRRASPRIKAFEAGFRKDAFAYLLTLRLIPVTPFWLVNLAAGLLGAPARAFVVATVIGILPASMIYAGLGAGLDGMFDRGEHLGPELLLAPRIVLPLVGLALL
ncbi:MAG TPA: VTT domain-containing protein, partial [Caulobacteraceae bacterium]|nr:VTT domain-containing protein [Caulobacteraceae bacterium]